MITTALSTVFDSRQFDILFPTMNEERAILVIFMPIPFFLLPLLIFHLFLCLLSQLLAAIIDEFPQLLLLHLKQLAVQLSRERVHFNNRGQQTDCLTAYEVVTILQSIDSDLGDVADASDDLLTLYESLEMRKVTRRFVQPLHSDGIDEIGFVAEEETVTIRRGDLRAFDLPEPATQPS